MFTAVFGIVGFTIITIQMRSAFTLDTALGSGNAHILDAALGRTSRRIVTFDHGVAYRIVASAVVACTGAVAAQQTVVVAIEFTGLAGSD